ncbi:MAG: CBS domain-containing protein [Rhizomicrobium sp.]
MRQLSEIICNRTPLIMDENAAVTEACMGMAERKLGAVLVTDGGGRLSGIFTARDAARRVLAAGRGGKTRLAAVMTRRPVTMSPEKSAIEALRLMWDGGFRHVPLIEDSCIVGVISRNDFGSDERLCMDEERHFWENMR